MNAGLLNVNTGKLRMCGDPRHYMRAESGGHGAYHACPWHPMLGAMGKHDVFNVSPSESHLVSASTGKTRSLPVLMVEQRSMNAGLLNVNTGKLRMCGDPRHYTRAESGGHGAYHACPWHPMLGAMGKRDVFNVSPSESHLVSTGTGKTRSLPVLMVEQRSMNAGLLNVNTGKHDMFYVSPSESHLVSAGTGKDTKLARVDGQAAIDERRSSERQHGQASHMR